MWNPAMYHGWGKGKNYFEGWYFKLVTADEQHRLAFIPGISFPNDDSAAHAFIQVLDGMKQTSKYFYFGHEDFIPSEDKFELQLGENFFSEEKILLNTSDYIGEINFKDNVLWPRMFGAPGIMGWFGFVPFMECFHGIVSMNHQLSGQLKLKDESVVNFSGGRGYTEKDWGRSFPKAYIWLQCNHFDKHDSVSLIASVAHIPWMGGHFIGFIGGFLFNGKVHRFATYTGASKVVRILQDHVIIIFKNANTELRIKAIKGPHAELISPLQGAMLGKINESMQAEAEVEFYINSKRVFESRGRNVCLEIAGEVELLL